jgi:hypothetical protein
MAAAAQVAIDAENKAAEGSLWTVGIKGVAAVVSPVHARWRRRCDQQLLRRQPQQFRGACMDIDGARPDRSAGSFEVKMGGSAPDGHGGPRLTRD